MSDRERDAPRVGRPRVVVVGPCAAGKTTLVRGLRARGYDAVASGQEHSEIATLFRHADPDVVIALDLDLPTLRTRRGPDWPESIYRLQQRRLATAKASADLVLDAGTLSAAGVLTAATNLLANWTVPDRSASGS